MRRPRDVGSRLRGRPGPARGPFSPPKQVGPVAVDPCRDPRVGDQLPGAVELREVRQRPPADEEAAVGGRLGVALRGGREPFGLMVGGQQGRRSCALVELDRDRAAGGQQRVARGLIIEPRVEAVAECLWVVLPGEQLSRIPVERQRRDIGAGPSRPRWRELRLARRVAGELRARPPATPDGQIMPPSSTAWLARRAFPGR
jgi:hypothetical protein